MSSQKNSKARVTVVTIAKDNPTGLLQTIMSVMSQQCEAWCLFLVVPHESKETYEIAQRYVENDQIHIFEDSGVGIYEAMNLACRNVRTDYVWFLNAGDLFYSETSLQMGLEFIESKKADLIIGKHSILGGGELPIAISKNQARNIGRWRFAFNRKIGCHQAMIFRSSSVLEFGGYSEKYRLAADFELALKVISKGNSYLASSRFVIVEPGGLADRNLSQVYTEKHLIRKSIFDSRIVTLMSVIWNCLATGKGFLKGNQSFRARM